MRPSAIAEAVFRFSTEKEDEVRASSEACVPVRTRGQGILETEAIRLNKKNWRFGRGISKNSRVLI